MARNYLVFVFCAFCLVLCLGQQNDRGFLKSPTARAAVWKYFLTSWAGQEDIKLSQDYDNLNCGGQLISKGQLDGKCGVCGDPYNGERQNERPNGIYAYNRPTFVYREAATINVTVEITKRSLLGSGGYFIFKLCDRAENQNQQCFDQHVISLEGGNTKPIPVPNTLGDIIVPLQLPQGVTCDLCTMQFTFITATVPHCDKGRKCTYGNEEEVTIVNCADIQIISKQDNFPSDFLWPDYKSQYSSLHVGKTTTLEPPPSTDKIIIVPVKTTASPPVTTSSVITTTTEEPPSTAEKLVLPVVPPLVAGGGGAAAAAGAEAAALGGVSLLPMGLLFALGLLGGELNKRTSLSSTYGPFSVPLINSVPIQTSYVAVGNPVVSRQMTTSSAGTATQPGSFSPQYSPFSISMSGQTLSTQQGNLSPLSQSSGAQLIGEGWGYLETTLPQWIDVDLNAPNIGNQNGQGSGNVLNQERWFPERNSASVTLSGTGLVSGQPGASGSLPTLGQGILPNSRNIQPIPMQSLQTMTQTGGQVSPLQTMMQTGNQVSPQSFTQNSPQIGGLMQGSSTLGQMSVVQGRFQNSGLTGAGGLGVMSSPTNGVISRSGSVSLNGGLPGATTSIFRNGGLSGSPQFDGLPNAMKGINNGPTYVQSTAGGRFFELPNNYQTSNVRTLKNNNVNTLARESQMSFGQGVSTNINSMAGRVDTGFESGTLGEISRDAGTMLEFDREPAVRAQRKSPYSNLCKREVQICRPSYGKTPTLYGEVSIFGMICDIECHKGNPNCPAEICTCICPKLGLENILEEIQDILKHRHHKKNMERERKAKALLRKMKGTING